MALDRLGSIGFNNFYSQKNKNIYNGENNTQNPWEKGYVSGFNPQVEGVNYPKPSQVQGIENPQKPSTIQNPLGFNSDVLAKYDHNTPDGRDYTEFNGGNGRSLWELA